MTLERLVRDLLLILKSVHIAMFILAWHAQPVSFMV